MFHLTKKAFSIIFTLALVSLNLSASPTQIFEDNVEGVVMVMSENGFSTGTIISDGGYLLTNWHVVENAKDIIVCIYGYWVD